MSGATSVKNALTSYRGKRVFITGHTGFKGSWLSLWLERLGANVMGYSLAAPTNPAHFELLKQAGHLKIETVTGDIRDLDSLRSAVEQFQPDIVIHMAAQPIVRQSYRDPIETYDTNVMGTLKVLEACRSAKNLRAIINVTSDKCYENHEWVWGYRETDPMGGFDPYSSSKGCAEILSASFQRSFFSHDGYGQSHRVLVASVRAGNVIGGGDWAADRLLPDLVRAATAKTAAQVRNPSAIRPWQHVLEPLTGYLLVGSRLLGGDIGCDGPYNFGPDQDSCVTVGTLLETMQSAWPGFRFQMEPTNKQNPHEAHFLKLDSTKARSVLGWKPVLGFSETARWTADWYRSQIESKQLLSAAQLTEFESRLT